MLIATMLHMMRRWQDSLPLNPAARENLKARRELAALPPELQRDIGWPPEEYPALPSRQTHNKNRSLSS
ncbi:hypothetical protein C0075_13055 [Rhizobium sp. KAs_5_22]|uniref:hypothetical protein n=1 Tax=Ciceribacter selenitireducens TaxID=448181 RepID=UPI0004B98693|nr:hypothetical protein [Ciceribacter selenitireducens]PPJ46582.1 hypothetical protein C0075_13055 [Rhizobium sp. KAs_5_22]